EQAAKFHAALTDLRAAQGSKAKVTLAGSRVQEIDAADGRAARQLRERLDGKPLITVYSSADKMEVTFGAMIDRLAEADVVCVGETHDSVMDHHVQLMVIKGLYAQDESVGVGMEMFQRPFQKTLDRYVSGAITEATFLEDSDYQKRWGFDWSLYRPIVDFCRRNRVALAGLNLSNELRGRISKDGYDKLTADEKKLVGDVDFAVKAHREHHFDSLGNMHGHGKMDKGVQERMYQVMTTWDEYMADSAVKFLKERGLSRLVVLAGGGHIEHYFGIPDRAKKRLKGGKVLTVRVVTGGDPEKIKADPHADFVVLAR
ncbi:MAG: ChaN family lipoprotein, partial [Gemmataceae bacterium]